MKVGLFVTNQQYLSTDMVSALDEQIAMVRMARDRGWDSLFSGQHYLNEGNNQQLQLVPLSGAVDSRSRRHDGRVGHPFTQPTQPCIHRGNRCLPWMF